jgi:phosphoglycerate dehydrogenase-like enzyme
VNALNAAGGLDGVALDVTDPEPLTDGHPLWSHPRAIVTPHTSGDYEGYFEAGADLLIANVERYRKEGRFLNVVDPEKGY